MIFTTVTQVDFGDKLVSADGALLWEERLQAEYSPNNNSGGGLIVLIVDAVDAAATRAFRWAPTTLATMSTTSVLLRRAQRWV